MATFTKNYELHLGDFVRFRISPNDPPICGVIQCLSELPDVFVEVGDPHLDNYNRYRISINLIEDVLFSRIGDSYPCWKWDEVKFEDKEPLEFVYDEVFNQKIDRRYGKV